MSVQNGERLATKQDLADMYQGILPYLGGMPEMVANKFSKGDLYDTNEKMIGKWIDGKPVYQKTINIGNLPSSKGNTAYPHGLSNVDVVWICDGFSRNSSYITNPLNLCRPDDTIQFQYGANVDRTNIYIKVGTDRSGDVGYVTLRYTKTTDSANSFNIGEATEYSTEEKIVGTWINGKPLYQKTVIGTFSSGNADTWGSSLTGIANIENVVSCVFYRQINGLDSIVVPCEVLVIGTTGEIQTKSLINRTDCVKITIQYTKTID